MAEGVVQKVKIAFLDAYHDAFYGAQKSMLVLVESLDTNRYDPVLVTTKSGVLAERFAEQGFATAVLPLAPSGIPTLTSLRTARLPS